MNVVLSLLLSLTMLFTGSLSLPDQPQTCYVFQVSDITCTAGDETVVLAPAVELSASAGAKEAALSFALLLNDLSLFPLDLHLDGETVQFGVRDRQSFTILDDDLARLLAQLLPKDPGAHVHLAAALFAALPGMISVAKDPEELHGVAKEWIQAEKAATKKVNVDVEGQTFSCKKSTVKLTAKETLSGLSAFQKSSDPHLQSLAHHLLGRYQYDVRKGLQRLIPEDAWKIIFNIVYGTKEEASYLRMEMESVVDMELKACADEQGAKWNVLLTDEQQRALSLTAEIVPDGFRLDVQSERGWAKLTAKQDTSGLWQADLAVEYGPSSLTVQAVQSVSEGGVSSHINLTAAHADGMPLSLAFRVSHTAKPYETVFADAEPLVLTDDTSSKNFQALKKQLLMLMPDTAVLMMDPSIAALLKLDFSKVLK